MTLRKKFIIFPILCGVIPVVILTILYIANLNAKSIELIKQNMSTFANDQSVHVEAFFEQNITNLNMNSNIPAVKDLLINSNNEINTENDEQNEKVVNEIFNFAEKQQSFLISQMLINKYGMIIADSDNTYINKNVLLSKEELQKLEQNEAVVTNIIESKDFNNGVKSVIIASPIFFEDKYQGAIASVINMNYFESLVNKVHSFKTGKIAVMDENGVIAAGSSEELAENISRNNISRSLYEQWKNINFDNNPNGIIEYNVNGIEKIGYYSRINNTRWIVLSGVEWAEFKEPINKTANDVIVFLTVMILIIMSSYAFIIIHFSRPVYELLDVIRKIKQGNYKDRFIYNRKNEFGEIATAFNELIDVIEEKKKHIENKNKQLQSLTSNIPGGVHRNKIIDGEHFVDFLSGGCLNLMGYKRHEFKKVFGKRIFDIIYEKDRERVRREVKEQIEKRNKFTVEYRIKRKDGSIIWLLDNGRIVKDREGKIFSYNVVINITDAKLALEELRLSEERYRIITSQTDDIIFEWNVKDDTVFYSGNWENKFDRKSSFTEITRKIYETHYIYVDDTKIFSEMLNDIVKGEKYREAEIRMKKCKGIYIWCKIRITAIFDANDNISKAIGVIINIDKEKNEAEELLLKAQTDSLTGLYNKGTTQTMVEDYIKNENSQVKGALLLIDLDNFKSINDNLGHLAGDFVLTNMSSMLLNIFKEDSIIGRIGGDEFIIFLKNIDSEELICEKAEELVKGFRTNFTKEFSNYKVSGSIGIAKYPEHGTSFERLYTNADKAAYLAKNKGKDNYCIFEEK
ncbi:diguanylate cyclase domain-containing protein [Clostridium sp.]|uniref:sensor domain-containing diguanylate cyclase n=1 Tax=Clostridium sp. TaxID=1506 RepID=UPI00283C78BB|nr:diguanylate cyclase [Clostridium sp.]MDR3597637.1 diguanylate cyclase [Clostridium sp.]